jgi:hypothetical protein
MALHLPLNTATQTERAHELLNACAATGDERFLDALHYALQLSKPRKNDLRELNRALDLSDSVWRGTPQGLKRYVDPLTENAYEAVVSTDDAASAQLAEAWARAYDRETNPSDAWDHAIKAVEAILIPIVVPNQDQPQIGHVVGTLASQGHLWRLGLPGADGTHSVAPLVEMLRLLWPNTDRHHGSPKDNREPTLAEAQAAVHLAVTIVQWGRDGLIGKP